MVMQAMTSHLARTMRVPGRCANSPRRGRPCLERIDMPEGTCLVVDCERPLFLRRRCDVHYRQFMRDMGVPAAKLKPSVVERLWTFIDRDPSGCWLWNGNKTKAGYGKFKVDGRDDMAHRVVYRLIVDEIPEGLHIDHLCRVRACVNPSHLEPVTHAENMRRGDGYSGRNARKTHCKHGHEFSPENTTIDKNGHRRCNICHKAWGERRYREGRDAAGLPIRGPLTYTEHVATYLSYDVYIAMTKLAEEKRQSMSATMRELIERGLND